MPWELIWSSDISGGNIETLLFWGGTHMTSV